MAAGVDAVFQFGCLRVRWTKLEREIDLMLRSGERLSQIALNCGHCDQSHFTRVFRRKVGMSPRAWRRQFATNGAYDGRLRNSESTLPNR